MPYMVDGQTYLTPKEVCELHGFSRPDKASFVAHHQNWRKVKHPYPLHPRQVVYLESDVRNYVPPRSNKKRKLMEEKKPEPVRIYKHPKGLPLPDYATQTFVTKEP